MSSAHSTASEPDEANLAAPAQSELAIVSCTSSLAARALASWVNASQT